MDFKYVFNQIDSFSVSSCCYDVIDVETNKPISVMVFGYDTSSRHFYICQAGPLWNYNGKNFGTKNRIHNSTVFRCIIKEMIDLFNLLGTEFVKPEGYTEPFLKERHEIACDPIYLYSQDLSIDRYASYRNQILTEEEYVNTLIKDGALEFVYAEYDDEDYEAIRVDNRDEAIAAYYELEASFNDSYFEIIYDNL